jgi:hypothetical protein
VRAELALQGYLCQVWHGTRGSAAVVWRELDGVQDHCQVEAPARLLAATGLPDPTQWQLVVSSCR